MARIFIKTFGCALNQSDSELMAGLLEKEGHRITSDESKAELVIINSCTVKNEAENKLYKEIRKQEGKKIVIAGCVAQADRDAVNKKLRNYSIIGTSKLTKIGLVVEETLEGTRVVMLDSDKDQRLNLPKIRKNDAIEIIPISEGCLGACTYCKTKHARGNLYSYSKDEIIKQAKKAVKEGAKEIWLTSQDTGAYGLDTGTTLPELLKGIIKIKGDFKIRLGMLNPNFAIKYLDELSFFLSHEKMFRFIHLPVQSGSSKVLKDMGRRYSAKDFEEIFCTLKAKVSGITIATDIIVGFPTETQKDYEKTLMMIKKLKPDILNVSRFWPRPGTVASHMKPLDSKTVKERSTKLSRIFSEISLENNKKWIGWKGEAVIGEKSKDNTLTARNFAYKPIIIADKGQNPGEKVEVKIKSASTWDLRG